MELIVTDDYQELSERAALIVAAEIEKNAELVLGLPTGSTPKGFYSRLVRMHREKNLDFSGVTVFNLDEYVGLPPGHPQSYSYYMRRNFFDHINIGPGNIHIPYCNGKDPAEVCLEYEREIAAVGGIDIQILGIGVNGHIGFNEPGSSLHMKTNLVNLAKETINANSRFFDSKAAVPRQAITMGVGSIMHAARLLLLASGESKAWAIKESLSGSITTMVPASLIQLHRNLIVIVDKEAAALFQNQA